MQMCLQSECLIKQENHIRAIYIHSALPTIVEIMLLLNPPDNLNTLCSPISTADSFVFIRRRGFYCRLKYERYRRRKRRWRAEGPSWMLKVKSGWQVWQISTEGKEEKMGHIMRRILKSSMKMEKQFFLLLQWKAKEEKKMRMNCGEDRFIVRPTLLDRFFPSPPIQFEPRLLGFLSLSFTLRFNNETCHSFQSMAIVRLCVQRRKFPSACCLASLFAFQSGYDGVTMSQGRYSIA